MNTEKDTVAHLIELFQLKPLPGEGGLYAETYRSGENIPREALANRYSETKPCGTAILYMLLPGDFSTLHRLPSDEIYHFYLGDPVEMLLLLPDGSSQVITLGQDVLNGQKVQFVAPSGVWQGSRLLEGGRYALLGTTMAPGFTPSDFEAADPDALLRDYPAEAERIAQLTHSLLG